MIIDKQLEFSSAQAETTVAAHDSTNIVNMTAAGNAGEELYLVIRVETALTSDGAATLQVKFISDSAIGFATAPVTHFDTGAVTYTTFVDKYTICRMRLPTGVKQYCKVTYTIGTAALTAGKFDAFLTKNVQTNE